MRLEFNDKLDPKLLEQHLKLIKREKLSSTELKYTIAESERGVFLVKIRELVYNSPIDVVIDDKLLDKGFKTTVNSGKRGGSQAVNLDEKLEPLKIYDEPIMVSTESGGFAIRLFLQEEIKGDLPQILLKLRG